MFLLAAAALCKPRDANVIAESLLYGAIGLMYIAKADFTDKAAELALRWLREATNK